MIEIREVRTKFERRIFAAFNEVMYRSVPQAIPDLVSDEYDTFSADKNPAYEYCDVMQWLAWKDNIPVGRIAGIINRAANEKWGTKRIRFTRVDFVDDEEVSSALFRAVESWGREQGMTEVHGPIGFCDLDQEGMLLEGFEEPGMFITIYNAPYYTRHMERLGFKKDVDWVEFRVKVPDEPNERIERLNGAVLKRFGLRLVEPRKRKEIKPYIRKIFDLLNLTYSSLYGTVPLTDGLIQKYCDQFLLLLNPSYVKLLLDEHDHVLGMGAGIPSLSKASKKSRGRLFPFGWFRLLTTPYRKSDVLDLILVGVVPEYQNKGLTAILISAMTKECMNRGIQFAETGPELETNFQVQALWKHFQVEPHKKRRCWIKTL